MCLPNGTNRRLISIQYFFGSFSSSAHIVRSGDELEIERFVDNFHGMVNATETRGTGSLRAKQRPHYRLHQCPPGPVRIRERIGPSEHSRCTSAAE
jgi:hypothetical protein